MKDMGAFKEVPCPQGVKVLGTLTRTEYKIDNGIFTKRKVRLCIRGDQQEEGRDYNPQDLYAPTLKSTEARLIAAISAQHGNIMWKTDCKQAFLNGDMDVDLYVRPPDWWPEKLKEGNVLLLCKSIYGTRQAARRWHIRIASWMSDNGYHAVNNEETIFMKPEGDDWIMHGLYVDDMQHSSTSQRLKNEFMTLYQRDFTVTGGETMETFLGMQVEHHPDGIHLHMTNYLDEVLSAYQEFIRRPLRPKRLPEAPNHCLSKDDCPEQCDPLASHYRSYVMKLQFLATWIRFYISHAVSQLASFCSNPGRTHWAALHLMEYHFRHTSFTLKYKRGVPTSYDFDGFVDSDWGTTVDSRRSTTGYISRYFGTPISWKSKLQTSVAFSSAEAEYMAASDYVKEVIYMRNLLKNMGFEQGPATVVYEDNSACIEWGNNIIGGRERAKHIDIRKHFAHEAIMNGHLVLTKIPTDAQLADIMTKGLKESQHSMCITGLLGEPLTPSPNASAQEGVTRPSS